MATPNLKVYTASGEYIAAVRDAEDAAALVGLRGEGATVRYGHRNIVWREGSEERSADQSYDFAAGVIYQRIDEIVQRARARRLADRNGGTK